MDNANKGKSPFYPGQPVPKEFFTGRSAEIQRILRAIRQVELGKPQAIFITGEYGIGKSSLASFIRELAESKNNLLGIHVLLGGAATLEDVGLKTVEAAIKSQAFEPKVNEKVRNFFSKYIGNQELFGINIKLEALKADIPNITQGFLPFIRELYNRLAESDIKGIMLILDEINGITGNPQFAHFIKALVDENALSRHSVPLMLVLCGVESRLREMIQSHQPVERIFDIVNIQPMSALEMKDFFEKTFGSANLTVREEAMALLLHYSAGFPKFMHIIGDNVFWIDQDNIVDQDDAFDGIFNAAEDIGRKFVDQQVYKALHSKDYHSILAKLGKEHFDLSFLKSSIEQGLSDSEQKKFNNFLQRMKKLNVLRSGDERGEYIFNSRLVRYYILVNSLEKSENS